MTNRPTRTAGRTLALATTALILLSLYVAAQAEPAVEMRGRARSHAGKPLVGATIHVLEQPDPLLEELAPRTWTTARVRTTKTSARGIFRIRVPPGRQYRVWAVDPTAGEASPVRHDSRPSSLVSLRSLRAAGIAIELPEAPPLAFTLFGFDPDTRREFLMQHGRLDAHEDALRWLAPGRYRLRIRTEDGRAAESSFRLGPGQSRTWRPKLARPARIRFTGRDIASLQVELPPALRFDDRVLRPDHGIVRVPALGLVARIAVQAGDRQRIVRAIGPLRPDHEIEVPLALPPARRLVVQRPEGSPPGELLLLTDGRYGTEPRVVRLHETTETITGLPQGTFVSIYRDERGQRVARAIEPDEDRIVLAPRAGASVTLQVEDADGMRVRDARVFLFARRLPGAIGHEQVVPPIVRVPRRNGVAELSGLVAGDYELRILSPLAMPHRRRITLARGQQLALGSIRLTPGYRLHGRVLDPTGNAAAGVLVTLAQLGCGPDERPVDVVTDSNGEFQFTGLADETFVVEARRTTETRSELARLANVAPGPDAVLLRLADEDPKRRGK